MSLSHTAQAMLRDSLLPEERRRYNCGTTPRPVAETSVPAELSWIELLDPVLGAFGDDPSDQEVLADPVSADIIARRISRRLVETAKSRAALTAFVGDIITAEGMNSLCDCFRRHLKLLLRQTLEVEVGVLREQVAWRRDQIDGRALQPHMLASAWWCELLTRYPMLARHIAVSICNWESATREMLSRLISDYPLLVTMKSGVRPLVCNLKGPLADLHHNGRSVYRLDFTDGNAWFYKTRALTADRLHADLVEWIAANGGPIASSPVVIHDQGDYGWMQSVRALTCQSGAEIERFYKRMGMHLCIAHLFDMSDLHGENFVANGEFPVIIDAETFFAPQYISPTEAGSGTASQACDRRYWQNSVCRTAMLPRWLSINPVKIDRSAALVVVITDDDRAACNVEPTVASGGMPCLDGEPIPANSFVECIVDGFSEMGRFFISKRELLKQWAEFWSRASEISARVLFRQTRIYSHICKMLLHPTCLTSGNAASVKVNLLFKGRLEDVSGSELEAVFEAERSALLRLDIPHFSVNMHRAFTTEESGLLSRLFIGPPTTHINDRLSNWTIESIHEELALIRASLISHPEAFRHTQCARELEPRGQ